MTPEILTGHLHGSSANWILVKRIIQVFMEQWTVFLVPGGNCLVVSAAFSVKWKHFHSTNTITHLSCIPTTTDHFRVLQRALVLHLGRCSKRGKEGKMAVSCTANFYSLSVIFSDWAGESLDGLYRVWSWRSGLKWHSRLLFNDDFFFLSLHNFHLGLYDEKEGHASCYLICLEGGFELLGDMWRGAKGRDGVTLNNHMHGWMLGY